MARDLWLWQSLSMLSYAPPALTCIGRALLETPYRDDRMTEITSSHIILTRFNLPSTGHESVIRAQEGWLRNRVGLFEKYCLPSVIAQTSRNFCWIIYFDPESPLWLKNKICEWATTGTFRPIFRASVSRAELLADIRSVIDVPAQSLITTNLDNDDGLAIDFIERLQSIPWEQTRVALYLPNGLIKCGSRIFRRKDTRNAFCSVRESWTDPVTCWATFHNQLGLEMREEFIYGSPAWLQVIHDTNVSNRVRGTLCSPNNQREAFPGLLTDVVEPSIMDFARDLVLQAPRRATREAFRAAVKKAIYALFGLQGLNSVKVMWTRLSQTVRTTRHVRE